LLGIILSSSTCVPHVVSVFVVSYFPERFPRVEVFVLSPLPSAERCLALEADFTPIGGLLLAPLGLLRICAWG